MENIDSESFLVLCAFIFASILYLVAMIKGPRLGIVNKGVYFDRTKVPSYIRFLAIIALLSVSLGYIVTRRVYLALGFAGLNLLLGAIIGLQLFLYRRLNDKKEK